MKDRRPDRRDFYSCVSETLMFLNMCRAVDIITSGAGPVCLSPRKTPGLRERERERQRGLGLTHVDLHRFTSLLRYEKSQNLKSYSDIVIF